MIYQLRITLLGIDPPVWRRIQMPGSTTLRKLHQILQIAMPWTNSHLYQFIHGKDIYGVPDREFAADFGNRMVSDKSVALEEIAPRKKSKFIYEYDFGDSWEHEIVVEQIADQPIVMKSPLCLGGQRACPPDDCGGAPGYEDLLEAIGDPEHPEHETLLEWIGGSFDPEKFDLEQVNRRLLRLKLPG